MKDIIHNFIERCKNDIPGFMAVAITDIESGMPYESVSVVEGFDPNLAGALNLEVVKAKLAVKKALNIEDQLIKDIIITLTREIHIIDISDSATYFVYLAVDLSEANLGLTRTLLRKIREDLVALDELTY